MAWRSRLRLGGLLVLRAAMMAEVASAEDMCGANFDIPCSLYGCGAPNEQGIWGQRPCFNYYPRDCQITFQSAQATYDQNVIDRNITILAVPPVSAFGNGTAVSIHDAPADPLVLSTTGEVLQECSVTAVAYTSCQQDLTYRDVTCTTETSYPDLVTVIDDSPPRTLSLASAFSFAPDGKTLQAAPIAAEHAVSLYSALRGTATVLSVTCTGATTHTVVDSCLLFKAQPANESPSLMQAPVGSLQVGYRFQDPPVATLTFTNITADTLLSEGNGIVAKGGEEPSYCNGEVMEYQAEDGRWVDRFLGSDGHYVYLNHVIYVDGQGVSSATIQTVWAPIYQVVASRNLRIEAICYDAAGASLGDGYLYFASSYGQPTAAALSPPCGDINACEEICGFYILQGSGGAGTAAALRLTPVAMLLAAATAVLL